MKLRISGNSLRYRVSRSELTRLMRDGRISEVVFLGEAADARLSYVLELSTLAKGLQVQYRAQEISVVLAKSSAERWAATEQVGIEGEIDLGERGRLAVLVEKDFACLDRDAQANADTFPNPLVGRAC